MIWYSLFFKLSILSKWISAANALTELSLKYQKPISLGISGPGMQERHAYARIRPVAERAVEAIVKITNELERIKE